MISLDEQTERDFFDKNFSTYISPIDRIDKYFMDYLLLHINKKLMILDIGGGGGQFANSCVKNMPNCKVTIVDPSKKMLDSANDYNINIIKIQGGLPNKLNVTETYDTVHINNVIHHIVDTSPKLSKKKVYESLLNIKDTMNSDSKLLFGDIFYDGHIYPPISKFLIFYLLKIQNILGYKFKDDNFLLGLNVCFYSKYELEKLINDAGFKIEKTYKYEWKKSYKTALLGIKRYGRIGFILSKMN
ncbi:class I SAM-dependent methyltransferase [Methanoplanus limicola]|uniref:Methyltransferase type 12 n=1 Tax=Methanoplanus limicola DSM 2279 TaxID=937775 RepID=H1Z0C4_9EURY|nr:class I SAM-dependent methyltransferase [Methanoplanus limicola]EHQ34391.1 Methyltransferase type 12 [Methanoplanus limicola DSM 2279]